MSDDPRRAAAIERLKAKRDFTMNVVSYVVVNLALIVIWALSDSDSFWPIWVIGGWGIGLLFHAWTVFGQKPITESDVEREMRRNGGDPPAG
jgi:hypothetical protein